MKTLVRRLFTRLGIPNRTQIAHLEQVSESIVRRVEALERSSDEYRRQSQVRSTMDWIMHASLRSNPLMSVILPTRNRRVFLERAIASVEAQSYANWELLVVDDASTDGTAEFLTKASTASIRHFRAKGAGVCAARNVALSQARGEFVTYLDDDNVMHPQWLKSVAWAFEQRAVDVLYGAFIVDDTARINPVGKGDLPNLYFFPYDHHDVAINNIADIGCIAHRSGLSEAHFDESLREMGDWDLFLRLTRNSPPLALPAVACFYSTDAPDRLSHGPTHMADLLGVRAKNKRVQNTG